MKFKILIILALMLALPVLLLAQHGSKGNVWVEKGSKGSHFEAAKGHFKAAQGEYGKMRRGGMQGRMMHKMLDLTDEQEAKIDAMAETFQLAQIDRKAELKKAQLRLKNALRDDQSSERQVFGLIDNVSKLRAEIQKAGYSHRMEFKAVLTAEQIEKLKEMRSGGGDRNVEVEYFFDSDDDDTEGEHEIRRIIKRKEVIDDSY